MRGAGTNTNVIALCSVNIAKYFWVLADLVAGRPAGPAPLIGRHSPGRHRKDTPWQTEFCADPG
jgi:hypothetical protein